VPQKPKGFEAIFGGLEVLRRELRATAIKTNKYDNSSRKKYRHETKKYGKNAKKTEKGVAKYNTRHHFEVVGYQCGPTTNPLLKG